VVGGTTSTYTSGTQVLSTIRGGLTTSYTTGGFTSTVVEAVASAVASVIGPCPGLQGRVRSEPGRMMLVACGIVYQGRVASIFSKRHLSKRATEEECETQCFSTPDCVGFSSTSEGQCRIYDSVDGQQGWPSLAYSAIRIAEEPDLVDVSVSSASASDSGPASSQLSSTPQAVFSTVTITTTAPASTFTTTYETTYPASTVTGPGNTVTVISASPTTIVR
jgi:hypothetical protein